MSPIISASPLPQRLQLLQNLFTFVSDNDKYRIIMFSIMFIARLIVSRHQNPNSVNAK